LAEVISADLEDAAEDYAKYATLIIWSSLCKEHIEPVRKVMRRYEDKYFIILAWRGI
jgi:hypothetical protein